MKQLIILLAIIVIIAIFSNRSIEPLENKNSKRVLFPTKGLQGECAKLGYKPAYMPSSCIKKKCNYPRISAREYYKENGKDAVLGDICDVNNRQNLKCLVKHSPTPNYPDGWVYWSLPWKKKNNNKDTYPCPVEPWKSNCKVVDYG